MTYLTRCIPFSGISFLSQSGMTSDGYRSLLLYFCQFLIKHVMGTTKNHHDEAIPIGTNNVNIGLYEK